MYEFPASPAVGDVANGYRYNGVGWAGGPIVPTPTEQWFDLSGKATLDVQVPAWAQAVEIIGCAYQNVAGYSPGVQVSFDGTTFLATSGNYVYGGSALASGTSPNVAVPSNNTVCLVTSFSGDSASTSMPHLFSSELNLTKPNASPSCFTMKSYGKVYDSAATLNYRSSFVHSYIPAATSAANLAIKALRFAWTGAATYGPGSWVRMKWLGDQVPQANGIVNEPPQDGNEYTRVNGVWRLKRQEFNWTASICDIPVPAWGPRRCTLNYFMGKAAAGLTAIGLRTSMDGTTFPAGASDYQYAGIFGQGGAVSYQGITGGTFAYLAFDGDNTTVGFQGTFDIEVKTMSNSALLYRGISTVYNNGAGVLFRTFVMGGWLQGINLKALRVFTSTGLVPTAGSYISAEWS